MFIVPYEIICYPESRDSRAAQTADREAGAVRKSKSEKEKGK